MCDAPSDWGSLLHKDTEMARVVVLCRFFLSFLFPAYTLPSAGGTRPSCLAGDNKAEGLTPVCRISAARLSRFTPHQPSTDGTYAPTAPPWEGNGRFRALEHRPVLPQLVLIPVNGWMDKKVTGISMSLKPS